MDCEQEAPDPWISVPDDLIVKIIARLPLPSLLRLRALNTRFLHITSSDACLHGWAHLRALNPWLLFWIWKRNDSGKETQGCVVHDVVSESWHDLPFHSLRLPFDSSAGSPFGYLLFGSGGGLVLLSSRLIPDPELDKRHLLFVCNLLTREWIWIPRCSNIVLMEAVGFIVDEKTRSYKIVVVGESFLKHIRKRRAWNRREFSTEAYDWEEEIYSSRRDFITEVYDSEGKAWRAGGVFPEVKHMSKMISCDKRLYCWSDVGVVAYSMEKDVWETIGMPERQDADWPSWLVRCAGMLMIVGSMKREGGCIMIWKFMEELGNEWMEVEAIPSAVELSEDLFDAYGERCNLQRVGVGGRKYILSQDLFYVNGVCCISQCVGVGGRIYILSSYDPDVPSIVYDYPARRWSAVNALGSDSWELGPRYTVIPGELGDRYTEVGDFQPDFLTSPY